MEKKRNWGELAIVAVCIIVGMLLMVQLRSVKANAAAAAAADAASAGRLETLQSLYNDELVKTEQLQERLAELEQEIENYRAAAASGSSQSEALRAEIAKLQMEAGLTDLEGPGVMVSLRDASTMNLTGDEADYIIHDNDLLSVVNELRASGAEAISLNGERLLATSEIRCAGSVVLINGRRYTSPFVFNAIGDPTTLYNALTMRGGVADVLGQWKIEVKVTMSDQLLVPKFSGAISFTHAGAVQEEGGV